MNQIPKHKFEAMSLLIADNGMLNVTIIPAENQPDWIIPSSLILSVNDCNEYIWTYLWQRQDIPVFHLLPRHQTPDKLVILEGNTVIHRLALQTAGKLRQIKVGITDVKDTELPEQYSSIEANNRTTQSNSNRPTSTTTDRVEENILTSYVYQTVLINNVAYLVPDLDKIAYQMVVLDS